MSIYVSTPCSIIHQYDLRSDPIPLDHSNVPYHPSAIKCYDGLQKSNDALNPSKKLPDVTLHCITSFHPRFKPV